MASVLAQSLTKFQGLEVELDMGFGHHHHHGHGHSHGHTHADGSHCNHEHGGGNVETMKRIRLAFFLNLGFTIFELVGGILTNSLAILSDAIHDLGDSLALGFAWYLEGKSQQKKSATFSYGYRRLSTMSALITGGVLVAGAAIIIAKAIPRIITPQQPQVEGMILMAVVGVIVNGWAAFGVSKGGSLNEKMITWHLIEDVMGWVIVLVGAIAMWIWDLPVIDAVLAVLLSCWVMWNVLKNIKETAKVFLQATPTGIVLSEVEAGIKSRPHIKDVHHLHVWSMDGEKHVLTAHLVVQKEVTTGELQNLKADIKIYLKNTFQISEATLEVEWPEEHCSDPEH